MSQSDALSLQIGLSAYRRTTRITALLSSSVFVLAGAMLFVGAISLRGTSLGFGLAFSGALIAYESLVVLMKMWRRHGWIRRTSS